MQQPNLIARFKRVPVLLFFVLLYSDTLQAQLKMTDFVLFGGSQGVEISSASSIQGGSIGSSTLIKTTGSTTLSTNIYSGGTVQLNNSNVITGKITAANSQGVTGNILSVGSSAKIGGNIDINGNIVIGGGTVSGKVTHPPGTTYTGPLPAGGNVTGAPTLPVFPVMPGVTGFPPAGDTNITSSRLISPGAYRDIILTGKQTLTFSGAGVYTFRSIQNSGSANNFVFDFNNQAAGTFKIYIHTDANLDKISASLKNGGSASRIYTEVHGAGATAGIAFNIANGSSGKSSKWLGTVWVPNGSINIGSGTGSSDLTGALLTAKKLTVLSGVTINYSAYADGGVIFPYYPPPATGKVYDILGSELNSLYDNSGSVTNIDSIFILSHDSVMIEVIAKQGQVAQLKSLLQTSGYGLTDTIYNGPNSLIITGKILIANLKKLDTIPASPLIDYCRPLFPAISNIGVTTTNGDVAIHSDFVRNGYNVSGEGVKVGVISDSYNTIPGGPAATDVSNGDLPGTANPNNNTTPVQLLKEYPFGRRSDEGRAMLQLVHDIAPKAQLGFRTGFISSGDFAQGIREFKQNNYNVIVDDVTYITEPFLQDGVVAQAVDEVTAQGVSYFAAAGNYANVSYQSTFNPVSAPGGFTGSAHNFGGGDIYQNVSLTPGTYTIVLQWQDNIYSLGQTQTGTVNDLDIYLTRLDGSMLFGFNRNNLGGDPLEILPFTVTANTQANLMIIRAAGTTAVNFKYVVFRGDLTINEYNSGQSTIVGQANSAGAMTVGAIRYNKTPAFGGASPYNTETFSSLGGTLVNGVNRNKPDFAAPDGVNTTINFSSLNVEADQFPNFFGTSAAAPHAAGVAALLLQSKLKFSNQVLTPAQMRSLLQSTALDLSTPGFDFSSGAGLIQAQPALATFAAPTPVIDSLVIPANSTPGTASFTLTVDGNYFTDQTKVLFRGIEQPTTFVNATQITASIPTFTLPANPGIQASTKPISINKNDGGITAVHGLFDKPKTKITIIVDDKIKKFGEKMPAFTATVLVDNKPLANSGLTLTDLGLDKTVFSTPATDLSNVGKYFIKDTFDLNNPVDPGLLELYDYTFINGLLTISKMPLKITPEDKTVTYGDKITGINFQYAYDDINIDVANRTIFLDNLKTEHSANLVDTAIAFVNGKAIVAGEL